MSTDDMTPEEIEAQARHWHQVAKQRERDLYALREQIRALAERWRTERGDWFGADETLEARCALDKCADEVSALLAPADRQEGA